MKSHTASLALWGLAVLAGLAGGLLVVAFLAPAELEHLTAAFEIIAGGVTALAGVGVGGMAGRDAWTGGITGSNAAAVLEAKRIEVVGAATNAEKSVVETPRGGE